MDALHKSATTIRQPAYAEVCIDSHDRYRYGQPFDVDELTTSSDWQTNLKHYALNGYFTRLALTQLQFQWNLPTIISGWNDVFGIVVGGDASGVQLTEGYYTPTTLAAEIEDVLQAKYPAENFTCTYNAVLGAFAIDNTGGTETFYIGPADLNNHREVRTLITLGFTPNISPSTAFIGNTPTMLPTRYINMHSSYIAKFQDVKDTSTSQDIIYNNLICRIYPVPGNYRIDVTDNFSPGSTPFVINLDFSSPKQIMWNPNEALANFDIQLRDEFGDFIPYDTANGRYGCEYVMTLFASET
jgi:hypothetical protein